MTRGLFGPGPEPTIDGKPATRFYPVTDLPADELRALWSPSASIRPVKARRLRAALAAARLRAGELIAGRRFDDCDCW